jgi:hypothetical protein
VSAGHAKETPHPTRSVHLSGERDIASTIEATLQRVRELSIEVSVLAQQGGLVWPDGYENTLLSLLDLESQAATRYPGAEWATVLANTHAQFVRQTSDVFLSALQHRDQKLTMRSGTKDATLKGPGLQVRSVPPSLENAGNQQRRGALS